MKPSSLLASFDPSTGAVAGVTPLVRHLGDLRGCFADECAYATALARGNPAVYSVASIEPAHGEGQLHFGFGVLQPGRIGDEYFLTKGHYHAWREAAEVYIGLQGEGLMLLEDERDGESRMVPLGAGKVVYVPGHTAHRTINCGRVPLAYLGVFPAGAGHDYQAIAARNFRHVVVERDGRPVMVARSGPPVEVHP